MHLSPRTVLEALIAADTVGCLFFYGFSFLGLASFLRHAHKTGPGTPLGQEHLPPVSILKPLKGVDPEIWESFCSHAQQQYPEFELIFGVSDSNDPACATVRKLQAEYPACSIQLLVCDRILGTNVKVSTLAQMLPHACHEILIVNDSDIRVPSDYLRQVVTPLRNPQVGLVTCLYRGLSAKTLGSRLESLGIGADFVPGVLSARLLEGGLRFGLGSTLVFRRHDLAAIGGFESFLDYLADDYELGRRLSATGKRVELSQTVVDTFLSPYTWRQFWQHQLRWSRTIRDARRWGYAGLIFTFGLPWSLATLVAANGALWAWFLFAFTLGARLLVGLSASIAVLHDRQILSNIFLLPLRDLLAPLLWAGGFFGNRIHWRGDDFYLKQGRLSRIQKEDSESGNAL